MWPRSFVGFHARPPASSALVTNWSTSSRLSHDVIHDLGASFA